jgi:hypothetical protein
MPNMKAIEPQKTPATPIKHNAVPTRALEKAMVCQLGYMLGTLPTKGKELPSIDGKRYKNAGSVNNKANFERPRYLKMAQADVLKP